MFNDNVKCRIPADLYTAGGGVDSAKLQLRKKKI